MPRPSIDQLRGIGDFATTYQWNVRFTAGPRGIGVAIDNNAFNLRMTSMTVPKATNEVITVGLRGHRVHQPGITSYGPPITLSAVETVDNTIHSLLSAWRNACWQTRSGVQQLKSAVQGDLELRRLDRQDRDIWGYKLFGCWLEDYDFGTVQSDASSIVLPSITLRYDYFEDVQVGDGIQIGVQVQTPVGELAS